MRVHRTSYDRILFLSLAALLAPLPFLLLDLLLRHSYYSREGLSVLPIYLTGALLEFLLSLRLARSRKRGSLSIGQYVQREYLLRSVLGLPFTVYLLLQAGEGYGAAFRFLAIFLLLLLQGGRGNSGWFVLLFFSGSLLFSHLIQDGWPRKSHLETLLFVALVLGGVLYGSRVWKREGGSRKEQGSPEGGG